MRQPLLLSPTSRRRSASIVVLVVVVVAGCVSVPTAPPPIPGNTKQIASVGAFAYDTAETNSPIGGAQTWARVHIGPYLDIGGGLQLSTGPSGQPRFVGGSLLVAGRYRLSEEFALSLEVGAEYVDAFTYLREVREPVATMTVAAPVAFRPVKNAWFWIRPAVGAAAPLRLLETSTGVTTLSRGIWPAWRLSYGASWDFEWILVYAESSTTLPFGGAFLGFGVAVPL